jgi:hypothetical protein
LIVVFNSFRLVREGEELEPYQPLTPAEPQEHKHEQAIEFKPRTA